VRDLMRQSGVHLQRIATTDDVAESLRRGLARPFLDTNRDTNRLPGAAA